jgi:hypothetical protein
MTRFAILGGGPTGLEAALALAERGLPFTLYEAASTVAGHVAGWGHVRLFTPWSMNVSARMRRALEALGRQVPDSDQICPTGADLCAQVYEPLALSPQLEGSLRLGSRVRRIGRQGLLKHEEIGSARRRAQPFRLLLEENGRETIAFADVVLDCTGNSEPNSLGDGGIPAPGEERSAARIRHEIPADFRPLAGRTTLLIGAGHSALTALNGLLELAAQAPATRIIWIRRGEQAPTVDAGDPLPERRRLGELAAAVLADPPPYLDVRRGRVVESLTETQDRIRVSLRDPAGSLEDVLVDEILALTGRVGDHLLYRQLQVHECYATSGPMKLAAALLGSAAGGDCLAQTSLGPETLKNPEPLFFILGAKSYGRRNDYLMRVGWQQVDEILQLFE